MKNAFLLSEGEALTIGLTFESEVKSKTPWIPIAFQLNFTDDFLEFFFNSKHLTHLSVFMFDYVQK